jgi:ATP-dependent DNA helicase HFM1/MER3
MFSAPTRKVVEPPPNHQPNMSRRRVENAPIQRKKSVGSDDFGDLDLDDDALVKASRSDLYFDHIDDFADPVDAITRSNTAKNQMTKQKGHAKATAIRHEHDDDPAPVQLSNGRWSCNHKCKDKEACKHYCCKHGLDKPPKKSAPKCVPTDEDHDQPLAKNSAQKDNKMQTKLQLQTSKRKSSAAIEELDLTQQEKKRKTEYAINGPRDYRDLHNLHKNVQKKDMPASLHSVMKKKPVYCYGEGGDHHLSFLPQPSAARLRTSSEYGDLQIDDFTGGPSAPQHASNDSDDLSSLHFSSKAPVPSRGSDTFGDDDSIFGEAIIGLADSQNLQVENPDTSSMQNNEARDAIDVAEDFTDVDFPMALDFVAAKDASPEFAEHPNKSRVPFFEATSSPEHFRHFKTTKSVPPEQGLGELQQCKAAVSPPFHATGEGDEDEDAYSDLLNMLDTPLDTPLAANDKENTTAVNPSAKGKVPVQSIQTEQDELEQIPDGFKDLQPWLFQEFGDIVELVDE